MFHALRRLHVATKLWLSVGVLCTLMVVLSVLGFVMLRDSAAAADTATAEAREKVNLATRWSQMTGLNALRTEASILSSDPAIAARYKDPIARTSAEISDIQKRLEKLATRQADVAQMQQIAENRKAMLDLRAKARQLREDKQAEESMKLIHERYIPAVDAYLASLRAFVQMQESVEQAAHAAGMERQHHLQWLGLAGAGVLAALIVLGAWALIRSIAQPLRQASGFAERIASGDLAVRPQSERADEFGNLMHALGDLNASLARTVGEVRQNTDHLAHVSAEIASGNDDLSTRTERTSSRLQQTASSMQALTEAVQHSASNAATAAQLAANASAVAERGGSMVQQVVSTMSDIQNSSRRIADIIGVIDGIAFQTNILALNAAVEAARAGEQGRGFAVVASEVRSLAQRSAQAAKEIKDLIGVSVQNVDSGSRLVADAGTTMTEIVGSVRKVSDIIQEITASANEQSSGIADVNQSVTELDQMTQQNAALVEQSAAAAQSLKEQASRLADLMAYFRTSDAPASGVRALSAPLRSPPA